MATRGIVSMLSRCPESLALVRKYAQATDEEISLEEVDRYGESREQRRQALLGAKVL